MSDIIVTHLGCPGHFIAAKSCRWRRHTQIGIAFRVSTVGNYYDHDNTRSTLGASRDSYFETMVFRTTAEPSADAEGCGCLDVREWNEIDGERYATAGAAQAGHEAYVAKYVAVATEGGS